MMVRDRKNTKLYEYVRTSTVAYEDNKVESYFYENRNLSFFPDIQCLAGVV